MASRPPLTRLLAEFVAATAADHIPAEAIARAKACLLDWTGSACVGLGHPSGTIVGDVLREAGGAGTASLVGSREPGSPLGAALHNGVVSGVMEVDDVHEDCSLHPGIGVIPAALATAEHAGASGRELLAAIVLGYEVSVRVARAAGPSHYRFWHTSATCNAFGAAAAAAKLLGLDAARTQMALGLAGTQAAGLWESLNAEATMAKHLHGGKAASTGVFSALLASKGFRGAATILEGEKGFLAASSAASEDDAARVVDRLGDSFLVMRNFFKPHACCRAAFEGIEGLLGVLRSTGATAEDVAQVTVTMRPARTWLVAIEAPENLDQAKFSLPFCMALAALHGAAGFPEFTEERLRDPRIRGFMTKVRLASDPAMAAKARVEVRDRRGAVQTTEPVCRSLDIDGVREKFRRNLAGLLGAELMAGIPEAVDRLDAASAVTGLSRLLCSVPEPPRRHDVTGRPHVNDRDTTRRTVR